MIQIKTKTVIIGVLIALLATFISGWLLGRRNANNVSNTIINDLNAVVETYSYQIGDLHKQAAEKDQLIMSQKQAIAEGLVVKEELRKLKIKHLSEVTHMQGTIKILLDSIQYISGNVPPTIPSVIDDEHPVLYLPLVFREQNEYLNLRGEFAVDGNLSMDISLPLQMDIFTGWDKSTKQYKCVATHSNPYLQSVDIRSIKIGLQKPRRVGLGIIGGYGMAWGTKFAPIIGIGVSYNLIQF